MGLGLGLGFSTIAMRVRAAGAAGSTWTVGAAADAAMWRVCTGPVRSVWGALNCQSNVPARLSTTARCSANTNAPQPSKLRVLGRPDRATTGIGLGGTVLMGSQGVGQGL